MDAPPDHDEGHSSGDALALPSGASSPSLEPATLASQRSNGTEQMAAHRRILALNKVWKDRRTRRSADSIPLYASSSSDTDSDSDSPPAAELPPASEPVPRPSGTPRAASPPDLASDLVVVTNRPVGAPCISRTRVPLPNFLPPLHIASSSHTASRAVAGSGPASSSASSSASSVPAKSVPAKSVPASANIEVARTQALRLTTESALKHLRQTQAYEATSNSQTATSDMHFPTPSELLAKIRQGVAETKRAASSPTPLGLRARGFRRSSNGTDGQDDQGDRGHLPGSDDKSQLVQDKDIILLETLDGRLYTQFPRADGCHELGRGALFPTNYAIRPVAPQYICPVRDCRRLMRSILALGGHFSAKHCYTKFNDNLDGTLSVVARYKNSNTSPAIVVSRNRPAPDAPPAVEPSLPIVTAAQKRRRLELGLSVSEPSTPAPVRTPLITSITSDIPTPSPPPPPKDGLPSHVCRYLHGFLSGKQEIPSRGDVQYMIRLPKRRAMPECWIQRHQGERLVVSIYAVSLAYLVGDEVKGADACPQTYQQAGRLSSPCIVLPSAMPESLKRIFFKLPTCLGCFYRCTTMRQRNICSYTLEAQAQAQAQAQAEVALSGVAAAPGRVGPGLAKEGPARVSKKEVGDDKAGEESDGSTAQTLASASASTRSRARPLKRRATDANVNHAPKAIKLSVESAERPESMLEMESWEMAPGRVTEESGNENVAFSGALLTSAQPVPTLPDIGIHVIVVRPGTSNRWGAEANTVRACTVAAGKVRVKIGETSFLIGLNGAFTIKPGQSCLVENRFYLDATIHCFSVNDYGLVPEP